MMQETFGMNEYPQQQPDGSVLRTATAKPISRWQFTKALHDELQRHVKLMIAQNERIESLEARLREMESRLGAKESEAHHDPA